MNDILALGEEYQNYINKYTIEIHNIVKKLVNFRKFYNLFEKYKFKYHLPDGCEYFLKNIDKYEPPNFIPDNLDILLCRRKTIGQVTMSIKLDKINFELVNLLN